MHRLLFWHIFSDYRLSILCVLREDTAVFQILNPQLLCALTGWTLDKVLHNVWNEADSCAIDFLFNRSAGEIHRAFNPNSAVHDRLLSESTSPLKTSPYLSSHYCSEGTGVIMCEIGLDVVWWRSCVSMDKFKGRLITYWSRRGGDQWPVACLSAANQDHPRGDRHNCPDFYPTSSLW